MKKFLASMALVTAVVFTGISATINWGFESLIAGDGVDQSALNNLTAENFIFATGYETNSSGVITSVTTVDGFSNAGGYTYGSDQVVMGTYTDSTATDQVYSILVSVGENTYYALLDSNDKVLTYSYTHPSVGDNPTVGPDSYSTEVNAFLAAGESGTYKVAAAVPEPATALMALAGIACLLRRRRA